MNTVSPTMPFGIMQFSGVGTTGAPGAGAPLTQAFKLNACIFTIYDTYHDRHKPKTMLKRLNIKSTSS